MAQFITPHNLEAERAVLGAAMLNERSLFEAVSNLTEYHFYDPQNRLVFKAILMLTEKQKVVDMITVTRQLQENGSSEVGAAYVSELAESYTSVYNTKEHINLLQECYLKRVIMQESRNIIDIAAAPETTAEALAEEAGKRMFEAIAKQERTEAKGIGHYGQKGLNEISKMMSNQKPYLGYPTGFSNIDGRLSGFRPKRLIVLAGRPGTGKSALAQNFINGFLKENPKEEVLFFSLEMTGEELAMRMISAISLIPTERIEKGQVSAEEYDRLLGALQKAESDRLLVDDGGRSSLAHIKTTAREIMRNNPFRLLVIDHLQIISLGNSSSKYQNRHLEISEITATLKELAKELDVIVLLLCQLNRAVESRQDRRPVLADLRESGSIEQDADIVMLLSRDDYQNEFSLYSGIVELNVAKHRGGRTGREFLRFHPETSRFDMLEYHEEEAYKEYLQSIFQGVGKQKPAPRAPKSPSYVPGEGRF